MRPWRLLITSSPLLLGYLFLMGFMTLNQDQLLYLPDPTPPSAANLRPRLGPALAPWPLASGSAFRGYVRAEAGATQGWRGTLVLFHGNAGSARDRTYYLNALEPLGVRVILAEYPGYGGRDGSPSQASLVEQPVTTLLIGTNQARQAELVQLVRECCPQHVQYVPARAEPAFNMPPLMVEALAGGAILYLFEVDQFLQV